MKARRFVIEKEFELEMQNVTQPEVLDDVARIDAARGSIHKVLKPQSPYKGDSAQAAHERWLKQRGFT